MLVMLLSSANAIMVYAQDGVTFGADARFYGDNTEFRNPFREGETIFGAAIRLRATAEIDERVSLTLGIFGNYRFGSDDAFELVRPIVSLTVRGRHSTFVMGTLPPANNTKPGPDLAGPHQLLPPFQRDTLAFERPYEAGLQWTVAASRLRQEAWLNWQLLNTAEHRERFDAGVSGVLSLTTNIGLGFQAHIVHQGGQLVASGPVADSAAYAVGLMVEGKLGGIEKASLEGYGVLARHVPDRGVLARSTTGLAFFTRVSASHKGWRAHAIAWRACDFVKDEGDPNYWSQRRDGTRYRGTRDYSEAGLTKRYQLAPAVAFEASGRVHRVENHYEYSYRLLGIANLNW